MLRPALLTAALFVGSGLAGITAPAPRPADDGVTGYAAAAAAVEVDGPTKVARDRMVRLKVALKPGQQADWTVFPPGVADVQPETDGRMFFAGPPGTYTVHVLVIDFENKTLTRGAATVTVGDEAPPPQPDDPLVKALKTALAAETDANKADLVRKLADVYRAGAADADGAAVKTWGDLFQALVAKATAAGVAGKLPAVQAAVAAELKTVLPVAADAPLDAAGRIRARVAFTRVAVALTEAAK